MEEQIETEMKTYLKALENEAQTNQAILKFSIYAATPDPVLRLKIRAVQEYIRTDYKGMRCDYHETAVVEWKGCMAFFFTWAQYETVLIRSGFGIYGAIMYCDLKYLPSLRKEIVQIFFQKREQKGM